VTTAEIVRRSKERLRRWVARHEEETPLPTSLPVGWPNVESMAPEGLSRDE
jgi:hypothetical protein